MLPGPDTTPGWNFPSARSDRLRAASLFSERRAEGGHLCRADVFLREIEETDNQAAVSVSALAFC